MSELYLGVDAGNSKTAALVATRDGTVVGWGRGGVGDIYGDADGASGEVLASIAEALDRAGVGMDQIEHTAFRLAGLDWPSDEVYWRSVLSNRLPACRSYSVKNDGYAMLHFASSSGRGVAATAGTAAAVAARGPEGREYTASFWIQRNMGGIGLGLDAYRAVVEAELDIAPATPLRAAMLELYGCDDVGDLIELFTRRESPLPQTDFRDAARAVLDHASAGDPVAVAIVAVQAADFVRYIGAVARKVDFDFDRDEIPIVLAGSIFASENSILRDQVATLAAATMPRAHVVESSAQPVQGAVLDALAEGRVAITDSLRARLQTGGYPVRYFDTQLRMHTGGTK